MQTKKNLSKIHICALFGSLRDLLGVKIFKISVMCERDRILLETVTQTLFSAVFSV